MACCLIQTSLTLLNSANDTQAFVRLKSLYLNTALGWLRHPCCGGPRRNMWLAGCRCQWRGGGHWSVNQVSFIVWRTFGSIWSSVTQAPSVAIHVEWSSFSVHLNILWRETSFSLWCRALCFPAGRNGVWSWLEIVKPSQFIQFSSCNCHCNLCKQQNLR